MKIMVAVAWRKGAALAIEDVELDDFARAPFEF
jgi:hypothetical protein